MSNIFSTGNINIDFFTKAPNSEKITVNNSNNDFRNRFEEGLKKSDISNDRDEFKRRINDKPSFKKSNQFDVDNKLKHEKENINKGKEDIENIKLEKEIKEHDDLHSDKVKPNDESLNTEKLNGKYDQQTIEKAKEIIEDLGYEIKEEDLVEILNMLSAIMNLQELDETQINIDLEAQTSLDIDQTLASLSSDTELASVKTLDIEKLKELKMLIKDLNPENSKGKIVDFKNLIKDLIEEKDINLESNEELKPQLVKIIESLVGDSLENIEKNMVLLEESIKEFDINTEEENTNDGLGIFLKSMTSSKIKGKDIQNLTRDERLGQNIIEQIKSKMKISSVGDKSTIEMNLEPENLGKLTLRIAMEKGLLSVRVYTQSEKAKEALDGKMEELKATLEEKGLVIDNLSVSVDLGGESGKHKNILEALSYNRNINKDKKEFRLMNEIEEIEEMIKNPYLNIDEFNSLV